EMEARGFESLWLPEHTHIPASRRSPWPGGGALPRGNWQPLEPFGAPATPRREVAGLDHISRGRVLFGIGGGWNAEEMEHHGTPFAERWKILRERIAAMKGVWTQ